MTARCAGEGGLDRAEDAVRVVALHGAAAAAADQAGGAGVEQLEVVVELGHRADRGARRAHGVGLVDRDRRGDAVDAVDLRLVHAVEELARVRGKGLDVAALALGVDRVEGERGLAAAAHARDDDELAERKAQVEALQVVLAGAFDDDELVAGACPDRRPGCSPDHAPGCGWRSERSFPGCWGADALGGAHRRHRSRYGAARRQVNRPPAGLGGSGPESRRAVRRGRSCAVPRKRGGAGP